MKRYFVRLGALGEIHLASSLIPLERSRRVVVRSPRGVEIAEVVSPHRDASSPNSGLSAAPSGSIVHRILRPTTESDEMLVRRLGRYKRQAIEACRERLDQAGSRVALLDVDQLLDGGTLLMHFLGEVDSVAQEIAGEIADQYESIVRTNHLSELLRDGCGPECGTGAGCGDACAGCSGCGS